MGELPNLRFTAPLVSQIAALEAEVARLQGQQYLPGTPHSEPRECPMWYDQCLCTVGGLQFNIKRADKAEREAARLREALAVYADEFSWLDGTIPPFHQRRVFIESPEPWGRAKAALEPAP